MYAVHLQTEYLTEPLGLGTVHPRFYWNCTDRFRQTAYQIIAKKDGEQIWDSGKVESGSMTHILYKGSKLDSRDHIVWSVRLWDENGQAGNWAESWFEIGLLHPDDWSARWITGDYIPEKNMRYPADCFLREFQTAGEVVSARLYITACGLYEAKLNDKRIGEFYLAPGCTDYYKRIQYQAYDVTELLKGNNRLEIQLADGWYRGSIGCFGPTNYFGRHTKLLCQLEITYRNGKKECIASNEDFRWSNDGPVRFADLKDGEVYDAGMKPSYNGNAVYCDEKILPNASDNVFPQEHEVCRAELLKTPANRCVLDFGQNMAGIISFHIQGKQGQTVRLLLGETLDEDGEFTQVNFQKYKPVNEFGQEEEILLMMGNEDKIQSPLQPTPKQEIIFTCSGEKDFYKTSFAVFGFRYALIETEADINPDDFCAIAVYSALEQTGRFECSNEKVNQLVKNTLWSMKSNYLDVPTDCPTRERLAWTGDAQIFFDTSAYFMNVAPFFRKWLWDVEDNQAEDGHIMAVVPRNGVDMLYDATGGSVGWGDAGVLIPYRYWKCYGDRSILENFYPMMKKLASFMIANVGPKDSDAYKDNPYRDYLYEKGVHLGEWMEPEEFWDHNEARQNLLYTEEATAYMHYTMRVMTEAAAELGNTEDEIFYRRYADGAKNAYVYQFLKDGIPDTDRQAKLVRPIALGLADGDIKAALEKRLAQSVINRSGKIGTGFLSTAFLLRTLTEGGYLNLAYKTLENEETPGWLYEVVHGATTIWESWEGWLSKSSDTSSLNHYSPGAVCGWLFDTVAGIRPDGENTFIITPHWGGSLTHACASYKSLYGEVKSCWYLEGDTATVIAEIPSNCKAKLILPGQDAVKLSAGKHRITGKRNGFSNQK